MFSGKAINSITRQFLRCEVEGIPILSVKRRAMSFNVFTVNVPSIILMPGMMFLDFYFLRPRVSSNTPDTRICVTNISIARSVGAAFQHDISLL